MLAPIYTAANTKFAYQLRWGITVHWVTPIEESVWLDAVTTALEADEIRLLSWRWLNESSCQMVVSTQPDLAPQAIIQRVKGRMQYAVRDRAPKALRPHYALRSFGTQERDVIEHYVAGQTGHHQMASERSQRIFEALRYVDPQSDLSVAQKTSHGDYWYNLHVVVVNAQRWCDVNESRLERIQQVLLQSGLKKRWRISRLSILADHLHATVGCPLEFSPESIVLSMMNNIAWVHEMKPILPFSAFVATFGEYDHRAIQGTRP